MSHPPNHQYAHQLDAKGGGGGVAGGGGGGGLSMLPRPGGAGAEEVTALTLDEMDSVARKLEEFARLHPDRVIGTGCASDDACRK